MYIANPTSLELLTIPLRFPCGTLCAGINCASLHRVDRNRADRRPPTASCHTTRLGLPSSSDHSYWGGATTYCCTLLASNFGDCGKYILVAIADTGRRRSDGICAISQWRSFFSGKGYFLSAVTVAHAAASANCAELPLRPRDALMVLSVVDCNWK